jgi:hypothetical protein
MTIELSPEIESLINEKMIAHGMTTVDELIMMALSLLPADSGEEIDDQTWAAIEEAEAQYQRGEGRPWEEVRSELHEKFGLPPEVVK